MRTPPWIKDDPRHLADATAAIEDYLATLDRLAERELPRPDTSDSARGQKGDWEPPLPIVGLEMVGATGIEPVTPSMSTRKTGVSAKFPVMPQDVFKARFY